MSLFPPPLARFYSRFMEPSTLNGFFDELLAIEKDAGIREALMAGTKAVKQVGGKANQLALKGVAAAHRFPGGTSVMNHILNPNNAPDLAQSFGTAARFLGG